MKEGSITRAAMADVSRTAIQVSGNNLLYFPIVPEKAGGLRREGLEWSAAGGKPNQSLFSIGPSANWNERPVIHGYSRIFESLTNAMKDFITNEAKVAPALAWTSS